MPPLDICIQVNIDAEPSKSGVHPNEVERLAEQILPLSRLRLRGLMAMPALTGDFSVQRHTFMKLRGLQEQLIETGYQLDTLSIGTTNDMRAAIAEGSTMIRIGTAIFGPRTADRNRRHIQSIITVPATRHFSGLPLAQEWKLVIDKTLFLSYKYPCELL